MYTKPVAEWTTPQHASLSRSFPAKNLGEKRFEAHRSDSKIPSEMYSLDSVPQKLTTESQIMNTPSKPIYISSGGSVSLPGYVSIPRANDGDDDLNQWKTISASKEYSSLNQRVPTVKRDFHDDQQNIEYQYQLKKLQAHLGETRQQMANDVDRLESQLGAREYDLEKMKRMSKEKEELHRKELQALHLKLKEKEDYASNLDRLLAGTKDELLTARRNRDSLQNYLREVPTVDELKESTEMARTLETENEKLTAKLQLTEKKLQKSKELLQEKINEIHVVEVAKEEVEHKVDRLNSSLARYRERDAMGPVDLQEYEECQWENEVLKSERDRLKKMVETKHKKLKALYHENQKSEKKLQEQISREEDTINAMREQANTKEAKLEELRLSVREISLQNQTLMEENLHLQDHIQKFEVILSKESKAVHQKVDKELANCAADLKSLVSVCEARAAGEEPSIASMLGSKGKMCGDSSADDSNNNNSKKQEPFSYESAKVKHGHVKELQACAEALRSLISEQYAEEIGGNCVSQ